MPFFTATEDVAKVLLAGGLSYAESLIRYGWGVSAIMEKLREKFHPIGEGPFPNQVYAAVINRAEAALYSGFLLNRRRTNNPLDLSQHTGMVGLNTEFEYSVVVGLREVGTGREFTKLFHVGSNEALGKFDVLAMARQQALQLAAQGGYAGGTQQYPDLVLTDSFKITDSLMRI